MIAQAQLTIVDLNDPIQQGTEPASPIEGMLWLDTSVDGQDVLKRWDGEKWVEVTITQDDIDDIYQTLTKSVSDIQQLSNQISLKVSTEQLKNELSNQENFEWVSEKLDSIIQQTSRDIEFQFNQSKEYTIEATGPIQSFIEEVKAYQRFSAEGLELGMENSPFLARLGTTKLSFIQDGVEIAYVSNNRLYITEVEITERLSMGNKTNGYFDWITTPTGMGLKWRG